MTSTPVSVRCIIVRIMLGLLFGLFTLGAYGATTVRADDGCDPSEPLACIPLPEESDDPLPVAPGSPGVTPGDLPSGAVRGRPVAPALPPPPVRCPPILGPAGVASGDPNAPAEVAAAAPIPRAPIPIPRGCDVYRQLIITVNRANVLYARAVRTLDVSELPQTWGGEALADLRAQVATLRAGGRYATPELLLISVIEIDPRPSVARVSTIEHWRYRERLLWSGEVVYDSDQWVRNDYVLVPGGVTGWIIVRDVITPASPLILPPLIPPPLPPLPPLSFSLTVRATAERGTHQIGGAPPATVMNTGTAALWEGSD